MSDVLTDRPRPGTDLETPVLARLSVLDRFLPVWIVAAMAVGLLLGRAIPGLPGALDRVQVGSVSLPIAVGLLLMMYPVLAKVRYTETRRVTGDRRLLVLSLVLNWVVGPALMFTLGWLLLPDLPAYRTGLIIVGLARCIAMVLIWNDLSCGDREAAAVLVAINSVFQIVAFAALGWFYLQVLPGWLGLSTTSAGFSVGAIIVSVLVFLGIPLVAGFLTRTLGERAKGRDWYEERFLPRIGPVALYGLLFTIVMLFALQGHAITSHPGSVVRIAVPLLAYFSLMFSGSFAAARALGLSYAKTSTVAFTATGNNFELAIAVCIGTFGVTSGQALAGVVGPLIEVPALVALVYMALWAGRRYFPGDPTVPPRPRSGPMTTARERADDHRPRSVNALSARSLTELGFDMTTETPKAPAPAMVAAADVVVTPGRDIALDPALIEAVPGPGFDTWDTDEPSDRASTASPGCAWSATTSPPASTPSPPSSSPVADSRSGSFRRGWLRLSAAPRW